MNFFFPNTDTVPDTEARADRRPSLAKRIATFAAPLLLLSCDATSREPGVSPICDTALSKAISAHVAAEIHTTLNAMRAIIKNPSATVFDGKLILNKSSGGYSLGQIRGLKIDNDFVECRMEYGHPTCRTGELAGDQKNFIVSQYRRVLAKPKLIYYDTPDNARDMALSIEQDGTCAAFDTNQWSSSCSSAQELCVTQFDQARAETFSLLQDFDKVVHD